MTDRALTVGDVRGHAATLSAMAAALLTGLASGKYDSQVVFTEKMILATSIIFPEAPAVEKGLEVFMILNKMAMSHTHLVLAGDGISWVPSTNSTYDPVTGRFTTGPFSG